jgi:hypothetical protein
MRSDGPRAAVPRSPADDLLNRIRPWIRNSPGGKFRSPGWGIVLPGRPIPPLFLLFHPQSPPQGEFPDLPTGNLGPSPGSPNAALGRFGAAPMGSCPSTRTTLASGPQPAGTARSNRRLVTPASPIRGTKRAKVTPAQTITSPSCQPPRGRSSRTASIRQNPCAASHPASSSCHNRSFSHLARTSLGGDGPLQHPHKSRPLEACKDPETSIGPFFAGACAHPIHPPFKINLIDTLASEQAVQNQTVAIQSLV